MNGKVVSDRTRGNGCPVCAGRTVLAGFNDLTTINALLLLNGIPVRMETYYQSKLLLERQKKSGGVVKCGHEWNAPPSGRLKGEGCPICTSRKVLIGYNDLATTYPAIATEWHPTKNGKLTPQQVTASSNQKVWWLGNCGHEWDADLNHRTARRYDAQYVSNKRLLVVLMIWLPPSISLAGMASH